MVTDVGGERDCIHGDDGIGTHTTHMYSKAVTTLSRLVFEYTRVDMMIQCLLPELLKTVLVLSDEQSREVVESMIRCMRVGMDAMK